MLCILGTLSAITFYLHTAHGVSNKSYGDSRTNPFQGVLLVLAALIFVNDTDLPTIDKCGDPNITRVVHDMQYGVDTWEDGLIVSGGALKPFKCKAQMVGFQFVNGC
eukprot:3505353-Ditylum_brightwellii.AAC.1